MSEENGGFDGGQGGEGRNNRGLSPVVPDFEGGQVSEVSGNRGSLPVAPLKIAICILLVLIPVNYET